MQISQGKTKQLNNPATPLTWEEERKIIKTEKFLNDAALISSMTYKLPSHISLLSIAHMTAMLGKSN